jgi:hypothetical protein
MISPDSQILRSLIIPKPISSRFLIKPQNVVVFPRCCDRLVMQSTSSQDFPDDRQVLHLLRRRRSVLAQ